MNPYYPFYYGPSMNPYAYNPYAYAATNRGLSLRS